MSCIAVLNAGSSSIKLAVYSAAAQPELLLKGRFEGIGATPKSLVFDSDGALIAEQETGAVDHDEATHVLVAMAVKALGGPRLAGVGHRVVHGGPDYAAPMRVSDALLRELERFSPLAPLHQPHNLAPIRAIRSRRPDVPQVVCFDTAFHRAQAWEPQTFALPRKFLQDGVRRYGFHGISYDHIASRLKTLAPDLARGRVIVAHLGNGASLCAIREGRSVASTMGFTAVDGLMMGTRCGALDPGVMIYLMDSHGFDARGLEDLVYKQSGLLGVSGISSDMRTLRASGEPAAAEAIRLFVYRIVREIGSLAAALGGLDGLVFTGGIGENDSATRAEVVEGCRWLGAEIDAQKNAAGQCDLAAPSSRLGIMMIPANEELNIAKSTIALVLN
jgi:acetate kinase